MLPLNNSHHSFYNFRSIKGKYIFFKFRLGIYFVNNFNYLFFVYFWLAIFDNIIPYFYITDDQNDEWIRSQINRMYCFPNKFYIFPEMYSEWISNTKKTTDLVTKYSIHCSNYVHKIMIYSVYNVSFRKL